MAVGEWSDRRRRRTISEPMLWYRGGAWVHGRCGLGHAPQQPEVPGRSCVATGPRSRRLALSSPVNLVVSSNKLRYTRSIVVTETRGITRHRARLTGQGQITVPKAVRDALGAKPG